MVNDRPLVVIGRAEEVDFKELGLTAVPARIDTGARTSSVWASDIKEHDGALEFVLFGKDNHHYSGQKISTKQYQTMLVSSSTGEVQERYVVHLLVSLGGRNIRARFTLADRSTQAYPILIGRNVLRGKFMVDVKQGKIHPELHRKKERYKRFAKHTSLDTEQTATISKDIA